MSFTVVGIGEVLWDLLPSGPELGGAPANFAYHAHALGAKADLITRVGRDSMGYDIVRRICAMGLPIGGVQYDEAAPTGTVAVSLANGIPEYNIRPDVAWDAITADAGAIAAVGRADALCFGSLAQRTRRSREAIQRLVAAAPEKCLRVFDINLRQKFYSREVIESSLRLANVLKMNDGELPVLAEMFRLPKDAEAQIVSLAELFNLSIIVLTRGGDGSVIYSGGAWSTRKSAPVKVLDTIGAGDAFSAAVVIGLLHGKPIDVVHAFAVEVAAHVCMSAGATPALPTALRNRFNGHESLPHSEPPSHRVIQAGESYA